MDQLASAPRSTKNTWPDLQTPRACIDTCGKAKKLFARQPLQVASVDESACSRYRCCPLHTRPRSVHEPRGWRGDEATSNLEGISAQRVKYEDQSNLQWPPMTLPANTGGRRHSAYWRPNCSSLDVPSNGIGENRPDVGRGRLRQMRIAIVRLGHGLLALLAVQ
jgi:hypothetical protein